MLKKDHNQMDTTIKQENNASMNQQVYLEQELSKKTMEADYIMYHFNILHKQYDDLQKAYNDLHHAYEYAVNQVNTSQTTPPPPPLEEEVMESIPTQTKHSWEQHELEEVVLKYINKKGEWNETIGKEFSSLFGVSQEAVRAKWEHCRFMETGTSEFPSASKLHKTVWKALGKKVRRSKHD